MLSLYSYSQTNWIKYPDNPVFENTAGQWDNTLTFNGTVMYYKNQYHMWYNAFNSSQKYKVGHAVSPDGLTWTKDANNPVFEGGTTGSWDQDYVLCGDIILLNDTLHMWYTGYKGSMDNSGIGHATSVDGVSWTRDPANPYLTIQQEGDWKYTIFQCSEVVYANGIYHMWYTGGDYPGTMQIGHATSPDAIAWTRDASNPVLKPGNAGEWEPSVYGPGTVIYDGNMFQMWYEGGNIAELDLSVGYATSYDGSVWTKYTGNPVLKKGSKLWETKYAFNPMVIDSVGVKYKMWYLGSDGKTPKIGYAESFGPAWKQMASMDMARHDPATCVIDNTIYLFGGFTSINSATASVLVYNTETNEWHAAANMDKAKVPSASDTINNKVYLTGGQILSNNIWQPINTNQEYNSETDSYIDKKDSPIPIGFGATCTYNSIIYKFGGFANAGENIKNSWTYNPANDTWNTISDMNSEHGVSNAQVVNDKMYVIGGIEGNPNLETEKTTGKVEMYSPQNNTWTAKEELPYPVSGHKSIVYNENILVFGGDNTNYIQQYNPAENAWTIMQGMPFQRSPAAVQKVGKYAYIIGGIGSDWDNFYSDVWRFNLDSLREGCEGVIIQEPTESFSIGNEVPMQAVILPTDFANKAITWLSDNEEVATVSASGVVSCITEGTANITAQLKYGSCYDSYTIEIPTGIDEHKEEYLSITPNPIKSTALIETSAGNLIRRMELIDLTGKVIRTYSNINSHRTEINCSQCNSGLYLLKIYTDKVYVRKVMVE